ncbi:MAG TPA: hypothetical protein PK528_01435, partial [Syntrophorhabdus sp.]|nr:hypothetical protein [Syntrophorhabdus sp.]
MFSVFISIHHLDGIGGGPFGGVPAAGEAAFGGAAGPVLAACGAAVCDVGTSYLGPFIKRNLRPVIINPG